MSELNPILCGIPGCSMLARDAAILGSQHFCLVPAMNGLADPLPLLRYNLCVRHIDDVRHNFIEVQHEFLVPDVRSAEVFI